MKLSANQKIILRLSRKLGGQIETARALGLTQASISRITGGRQQPSGAAVILARVLLRDGAA